MALVTQGVASSVLFLMSLFLTVGGSRTSVREAYDLLFNLTILIYFVPYIYLFLALVRLGVTRRTTPPADSGFPAGGRASG